MKFIITGSAGCVSTPRALCKCNVCKQAREKGHPYARSGCSLFLEDISLLIDTPEDINNALNNSQIEKIDYIFYSHLDPDHTLGMRVIEQLRLDWLAVSINKRCNNPLLIMALPNVLEDINAIRTKYGSILDYYESMNLIKRESINEEILIGDIKISFIPVNKDGNVTVFVFEKNGKKLIYAPCDVKPFPVNKLFEDADYLIIGNTIVGTILKDGFKLEHDNPLNNELFSLDEVINIEQEYGIKNVIITHLEEDWGKTYDDYLDLEKDYENVSFAYDGMTIEL
ncbi:MBL fold metallo-hydrolase [Clostridium estertheticum]|uniref:MBL fold metallo-hydrolase n=1 Tax=Clostridium estertheticum TaxID=238834 RepID=UPI001CF3BDC0|nr:MBL fold metallo-hydrolase [Clostridium estertheticum]MCB2356345.1 MBL fold metallo-hydrolase [Clostridium estertheticum]WAG42697.1 MBL fold metallo-hydrolase [Clostridium estertheticum]